MTTEIKVDFNSTDAAGLVFARVARASGPLHQGASVRARDAEGNECMVTVARIDGPIAYLRPDSVIADLHTLSTTPGPLNRLQHCAWKRRRLVWLGNACSTLRYWMWRADR